MTAFVLGRGDRDLNRTWDSYRWFDHQPEAESVATVPRLVDRVLAAQPEAFYYEGGYRYSMPPHDIEIMSLLRAGTQRGNGPARIVVRNSAPDVHIAYVDTSSRREVQPPPCEHHRLRLCNSTTNEAMNPQRLQLGTAVRSAPLHDWASVRTIDSSPDLGVRGLKDDSVGRGQVHPRELASPAINRCLLPAGGKPRRRSCWLGNRGTGWCSRHHPEPTDVPWGSWRARTRAPLRAGQTRQAVSHPGRPLLRRRSRR
jgi:hypothetical protein